MRELLPFLRLYRKRWFGLSAGILLGFLTTAAAISLLTLSGWFIAASAVAGLYALASFNYMVPAAGVRGFSIARTLGRWSERVVSHDATFRLLSDLRIFFFKKLSRLIPSNRINLRDADLLNRLVADVDAMDHVYLRLISPLVIALLGILLIAAGLIWLDPLLGGLLTAALLSLLFIQPVVFYKLGKPHGEAITAARSQFRTHLLDWLQGHAELSLFGAIARYRKQIDLEEQQLFDAQQKMAMISGIANATLIAANGFTLVLMLWFAADGVAGRAPDPLIAMVAFGTMACVELMMPIAGAFQYLGQTLASARRLNEIIDAKPTVNFDPQGENKAILGDIRCHQLHFRYEDSANLALDNISFHLKPGMKAAFLGRTGCGKSTLLQLITRAWDPSSGCIMIDDIPLPCWQEPRLRAAISVISQRVDLFNASLRHNLQLAAPSATDEQLKATLSQVGLDGLLDGKGLDQWLGDGGRQLSGGERRRLGIARVLLQDSPILLLDEPTEGLDRETERHIWALLLAHSQDKTLLFVTHRLIGLEQMDNIFLIEQGKIIEQGSHQQLLAARGQYASLVNQLSG